MIPICSGGCGTLAPCADGCGTFVSCTDGCGWEWHICDMNRRVWHYTLNALHFTPCEVKCVVTSIPGTLSSLFQRRVLFAVLKT